PQIGGPNLAGNSENSNGSSRVSKPAACSSAAQNERARASLSLPAKRVDDASRSTRAFAFATDSW
ncbi:MAG TPA: hypothetical protein VFT21_01595, partial [Gemmatimonadaceae bacterium]|nr:hypothetical protein [Gemmatimonadaceae bacterium]